MSDDGLLEQIGRSLRRAATLTASLLTVGVGPQPQPVVDPGDLAGTARRLRYWVADLEAALLDVGVDPETIVSDVERSGRATPLLPAEAVARLDELTVEVAALRVSEQHAQAELAAARAKAASYAAALATVASADGTVVETPTAGRPRSTRIWLLELLRAARADGSDGWLTREEIGEAAKRDGRTRDAVSSALTRARTAGEVEHDPSAQAWRAAAPGNVVSLRR